MISSSLVTRTSAHRRAAAGVQCASEGLELPEGLARSRLSLSSLFPLRPEIDGGTRLYRVVSGCKSPTAAIGLRVLRPHCVRNPGPPDAVADGLARAGAYHGLSRLF